MARSLAMLAGLVCSSIGLHTNVSAQTFILNNETTIEGKITASTNNTILVMEETGTIVPLSLADIKEVQLPIADREDDLAAQLVGWDDGIYELRTQGYELRVSNNQILSIHVGEPGAGGPIVNDELPISEEKTAHPEETDGQSSTNRPISNATM